MWEVCQNNNRRMWEECHSARTIIRIVIVECERNGISSGPCLPHPLICISYMTYDRWLFIIYAISLNVKLIPYQFGCTRCAFRLLTSHQWYSSRKKKCENRIRAGKKTKYCTMKLSMRNYLCSIQMLTSLCSEMANIDVTHCVGAIFF
jgi:hypothetical protein